MRLLMAVAVPYLHPKDILGFPSDTRTNLNNNDMNKSHHLSKREAKKDKSLMLKFKPEEESNEYDDMAYLTRRF